jgi:hypothetical protein
MGKRKVNNGSYANATTTAATTSGHDLKMQKASSSPYGKQGSLGQKSAVKSKSLLQLPGAYSPSKATALNNF